MWARAARPPPTTTRPKRLDEREEHEVPRRPAVKWRGVFQPLFESLKSPPNFVLAVATPFWAAGFPTARTTRSATPRHGHKSRSDDQVFDARGHDTRGLASHEDYDN